MTKKDKKQHRIIPIISKRKRMSLEDILASDEINGMLQELEKAKPNITDLIIIYVDNNGDYQYMITDGTLESQVTWALECTKLDILNHEGEE